MAVIHLDSVATMAARKSIQPLDDVAKALDLKGSDFAKVPWVAGIYRDVRYSIPLDVHPMGMFFNKTVMDKAGLDPNKPPQTQGDYMSALETLKSKGVAGHWASPFQFTGGMSVYSLVAQFGGGLFSEDTSHATWHEEPGIKAMTWWMDLVKKGYSPAKVAQDADFVAFQNGKPLSTGMASGRLTPWLRTRLWSGGLPRCHRSVSLRLSGPTLTSSRSRRSAMGTQTVWMLPRCSSTGFPSSRWSGPGAARSRHVTRSAKVMVSPS